MMKRSYKDWVKKIALTVWLVGTTAHAAAPKENSARLSRILRGEAKWSEEPKKSEELPGSHTVTLTTQLPALELRLWEAGPSSATIYALEFVLNTKEYNMEILDLSKVSEIHDPSDGTGFFWAQLPGSNRVAIDMKCVSKKKQCSGKWENFPYKKAGRQIVTVYSEMRGFEKQQWNMHLDPGILETMVSTSLPQARNLVDAHGADPGGTLSETLMYNKDFYKNPFSDLQYAPIRIDEWKIKKRPEGSGIGFHQQPRSVLFEVTSGVAKIDILMGTQYSTFEVRSGERLWTPGSSAVSVRASGGKGPDSAVLRRVEFP